jgi:hypothetical protein
MKMHENRCFPCLFHYYTLLLLFPTRFAGFFISFNQRSLVASDGRRLGALRGVS